MEARTNKQTRRSVKRLCRKLSFKCVVCIYTVLLLPSGMDKRTLLKINLPQLYAHCLFSELYLILAFMTFTNLDLLSSSGNLLILCYLNSSSFFIDQTICTFRPRTKHIVFRNYFRDQWISSRSNIQPIEHKIYANKQATRVGSQEWYKNGPGFKPNHCHFVSVTTNRLRANALINAETSCILFSRRSLSKFYGLSTSFLFCAATVPIGP